MAITGSYGARDRERWVGEDPAYQRPDRDDFARDRARLIHSAALRRLSAKTQVVQPGSDDFARTRLTHSLEVAQIGREFGAALGCDADVVDTACLAHDLGHPPFGHNGEEALDAVAADIGGFEGNAQTLRILTRLEAKRFHPDGRPAGLNLTRASLDAATKYPWARGESVWATKKFGVYAADLPVYEWFRDGVEPGVRCLEADVMDWADDVAYSVHDIEDAIASRTIDPRLLHSPQRRGRGLRPGPVRLRAGPRTRTTSRARSTDCWRPGRSPRHTRGTRADLAVLKDMTSRLISRFVLSVERATREKHGDGPLTRYDAHLVVPDEVRAEASVLKALAAHFVMFAEERVGIMAHQREVVAQLVRGSRRTRRGWTSDLQRRPRGRRGRRGATARGRRPGGVAHRRAGVDVGRGGLVSRRKPAEAVPVGR